jgi:hypothetical protein
MITVPLTQGFVAVVDDDDAWVLDYSWRVTVDRSGHRYARRSIRTGHKVRDILMHREISKAAPGTMVDHKDGDGLNNRRSNLRLATDSQNQWNRKSKRAGTYSRYKGVSWYKAYGTWMAEICKDGVRTYLGQFASEVEAAKAYDRAALEAFGEFAHVNGL